MAWQTSVGDRHGVDMKTRLLRNPVTTTLSQSSIEADVDVEI